MSPGQAVEDWLRRMGRHPRGEPDGAPSATKLTGPPHPPVLSSLEIVKRRVIRQRQVHALTYRDTAGGSWFWIVRLIEDDEGSWRVCGGGGGGGEPAWDTPRINLAGSWGPYGLALGGRVAGTGSEQAASARLRLGETVLVDDVGRGVVLFVTSEPTADAVVSVELLARDGSVLWEEEMQLD